MLLLLICYCIGHAENSLFENSLLDLLIRTHIFLNTHILFTDKIGHFIKIASLKQLKFFIK